MGNSSVANAGKTLQYSVARGDETAVHRILLSKSASGMDDSGTICGGSSSGFSMLCGSMETSLIGSVQTSDFIDYKNEVCCLDTLTEDI